MRLLKFLNEISDERGRLIPNPMPNLSSDDPRYGDWFDRLDAAVEPYMPEGDMQSYGARRLAAIERVGQEVDLPIDKLIGTEPHVVASAVHGPADRKASSRLPIVAKVDGNMLITDGNNRAVNALLRDEKTVRSILVDVDALEQRALSEAVNMGELEDARMAMHYVYLAGEKVREAIAQDEEFLWPFIEKFTGDYRLDVPPEREAEFKEWLETQIDDEAHEAYTRVVHTLEGGPNGGIMLYRYVVGPPDLPEHFHTRPVGIYWSTNPQEAKAHWAHEEEGWVEWLITAEVPARAINWVNTIFQNTIEPTEAEIQLNPGADIDIVDLYPQSSPDSAYGEEGMPGQAEVARGFQGYHGPTDLRASLGEAVLTELKQSTLTDLRRIFKSGRFEQVGYWLASNGWKTDEAHEGYYSKVYLNPQSNLVIKMLKQGLAMREMDEMRCQLNWLRYANKNWQDNPHLPRVHYIQTAQEKDIDHEDTGNTGYLVVMERLEKARDPYAGMSDEDRDDFASMLSVHMHGEPHEYMPYIEQPKDDWTMTPQEYELAYHSRLMGRGRSTYQRQLGGGKYQQLAQALEAMDKMRRRFGCHGDLHSGNVMLRPGTNELVVNDPFEG